MTKRAPKRGDWRARHHPWSGERPERGLTRIYWDMPTKSEWLRYASGPWGHELAHSVTRPAMKHPIWCRFLEPAGPSGPAQSPTAASAPGSTAARARAPARDPAPAALPGTAPGRVRGSARGPGPGSAPARWPGPGSCPRGSGRWRSRSGDTRYARMRPKAPTAARAAAVCRPGCRARPPRTPRGNAQTRPRRTSTGPRQDASPSWSTRSQAGRTPPGAIRRPPA
jgi:hypothetical protein